MNGGNRPYIEGGLPMESGSICKFWMKVAFGLFTISLLPAPNAQAKPHKDLLANPPLQGLVGKKLKYQPIAGHHINLQAPNRCGGERPVSLNARALECEFHMPGKYPIWVAVCDDKKTFCQIEKETVEIHTTIKDLMEDDIPTENQPKAKKIEAQRLDPKTLRAPEHGFIYNQPKVALANAKKSNQLLLIDFYGIWCPPCNLLDEKVFSSAEFAKAAKKFQKIGLDADAQVSWEWKNHFNVGGYPTLVVADHQLREIGRLIGYHSKEFISLWLAEQQANRNEPIAAAYQKLLSDKKSWNPARSNRVLRWLYENKNYLAAIDLIEAQKQPGAQAELWKLKSQLQLSKQDKDQSRKLLTQLLNGYPEDIYASSWALQLASSHAKQASRYEDLVVRETKKWVASNDLGRTGYTAGDLWITQAQFFETLAKDKKAKAAYIQAAQAFGKQAKEVEAASKGKRVSRGSLLEEAYSWGKAGDHHKAVKIYERLVGHYSNEFTYYFYYARALYRLKRYADALPHVEKSLRYAYGDNWLRASHLKAQILVGSKKKKQAQEYLKGVLAQISKPEQTQVRTHRYIGFLLSLQSELESAGSKKN